MESLADLPENEFDDCIRITLLGNSNVGKSTLVSIFKTGEKPDHVNQTLGFTMKSKTIHIDDQTVKVLLNDCSGQDTFQTVTNNCLRETEGFIVVYDVTDVQSFGDVKKWIGRIREIKEDDFPIMVLANKIDLQDQRRVDTEEGQILTGKLRTKYGETTFENVEGIQQSFTIFLKQMYTTMVFNKVSFCWP